MKTIHLSEKDYKSLVGILNSAAKFLPIKGMKKRVSILLERISKQTNEGNE